MEYFSTYFEKYEIGNIHYKNSISNEILNKKISKLNRYDLINTNQMKILAKGVGRRKESVASAFLFVSNSSSTVNSSLPQFPKILINDKTAQEYFRYNEYLLQNIQESCVAVEDVLPTLTLSFFQNPVTYGLNVKVKGGGLVGQCEAIQLAIARALCTVKEDTLTSLVGSYSMIQGTSTESINDTVRKQLKEKGLLKVDTRIKERRKIGLKKARKASQYHKR